jgi:uncharacterized protein (TIGR02118 family)
MVFAPPALTQSTAGGTKITVLYGTPKDPAAFDRYYTDTHMPMVYAIKGIKSIEVSVGLPRPDGSPPPFYKITELWFDSAEQMQQVTGTSEWKKVGADVANFASGGVTILVAKIVGQ